MGVGRSCTWHSSSHRSARRRSDGSRGRVRSLTLDEGERRRPVPPVTGTRRWSPRPRAPPGTTGLQAALGRTACAPGLHVPKVPLRRVPSDPGGVLAGPPGRPGTEDHEPGDEVGDPAPVEAAFGEQDEQQAPGSRGASRRPVRGREASPGRRNRLPTSASNTSRYGQDRMPTGSPARERPVSGIHGSTRQGARPHDTAGTGHPVSSVPQDNRRGSGGRGVVGTPGVATILLSRRLPGSRPPPSSHRSIRWQKAIPDRPTRFWKF